MGLYGNYAKKLKSRAGRSYISYATELLKRADTDYGNNVAEAKTRLLTADKGYGASAESLGVSGLSGAGGYAEYIGSLTKAGYKSANENAAKQLTSSRDSIKNDYADYMNEYEASQQKLIPDVIKDIDKLEMNKLSDMLSYALGAGLNGDYAKAAVEAAFNARTEKNRLRVVDAIINRSYGAKKAYEYAIRIGLSESVARELSDYAKKIRDSELSGSYLEGLGK